MTDRTETEVRKWALKRNGDPLTPTDAVELILAVDEDSVVRHQETVDVLIQHCEESKIRDIRIEKLEARLEDNDHNCANRVRKLIEEEHDERHGQHLDDCHADDNALAPEDNELGDLRRAWRFLRWAVAAFGLIFIDMFARYLSHTLFGYPS